MSIIYTSNVSVCLLIPSILDYYLQKSEDCGNMGLYGLFLEIYRLRNIVYLSLLALPISYFYNFFLLGSGIFLCSLGLYIKTIYSWRHILQINLV